MFGKVRSIAETLLVLLILGLMWEYKRNRAEISDLASRNATLAENLKSSTEVTHERIVYKWRDSSGTVHVSDIYVPPEGKVTVLNPKDGKDASAKDVGKGGLVDKLTGVVDKAVSGVTTTVIKNPETGELILVKKAGVCFAPALAGTAALNYGLGVGLQARLLYYNRWGVGPGISSKEYGYIFVDRRISDLVPYIKNTAVGIHGGWGWNRGKVVGGQIAIFL